MEISKNLILSGINKITLYDNSIVNYSDTSTNFFVKKEDIGINSRADVVQRGLIEMNNYAFVMIYKGELSNNYNILDEYQIVIITEIIDMELAETLNQYCRNKKIVFLYTAQFGLASFLFTDFGENYFVEDANGKECEKYFIKSITNSCPGIVEIDPIVIYNNNRKIKKYIKLATGDFVIFKNVNGMTELNDTPPRPIRVLSKTKFTIEDTSKFQEFSGSGMVEEVKIPFPVIFRPLSEAKNIIYNEYNIEGDLDEDFNSEIINDEYFFDNQNNNDLPWLKIFSSSIDNNLGNNINEKIHLAILSLHKFFNIHQFLPHLNEQKEIDECIDICKNFLSEAKEEKRKWANNLNKIDNFFFKKIFKFSRFYFTPMTCFLGGIISQEIMKFTGLYKPSNQWMYFNFLDLINENNLEKKIQEQNLDDEFKINLEPYMLFGKEKFNEIKNSNILIIGLNDIGYEILRILIMLNFLSKDNNIIILENNKNEIKEKINDLKNNDKYYNINIISEKIELNENLSEKNWWKKAIIIFDTLSYSIYPKEKSIIITNSKKDNKILFDINSDKSVGFYELLLPNQLRIHLKKDNNLNNYKEFDTPDGSNENGKEKIIKKKLNYKNICTLEESLKWSQNFFESNFNIYIKNLNELINKSDSEEEIKKYMDNFVDKENDKEKTLKIILTFKKLISLKLGKTFEAIVFYSIEIFQELFEFSVDEIFQKYPNDLIEEKTYKKFWAGARIEPKKIKFDINNEDHYQIIYYLTYFLCEILQIEETSEKMKDIKNIALKYEFKKFDLAISKKANNEDFFNMEKNSLIIFLSEILKINKITFKEIKINYFEGIQEINDLQNINKQIKFLVLTTNIKLSQYDIINKNKNDLISMILTMNQIFPTVASAISGAVIIQLFNMFNDIYFIDFIKLKNKGKTININEIEKEGNNDENHNRINISQDDKNISFYKNYAFNFASNIYLNYDIL